MTPADEARALLDAASTRREIRRLAPRLDAEAGLRDAVWAEGRRRGVDLGEEALRWPARRLIRVARGREVEARRRSNPIAVDEDFACAHCGAAVAAHGRTARNHCPACLRSMHVDVVPGDRAADCGGIMDPVGVEVRGLDAVLEHRCRRCGYVRRARVLQDGDAPDDWAAVVRLASGGG